MVIQPSGKLRSIVGFVSDEDLQIWKIREKQEEDNGHLWVRGDSGLARTHEHVFFQMSKLQAIACDFRWKSQTIRNVIGRATQSSDIDPTTTPQQHSIVLGRSARQATYMTHATVNQSQARYSFNRDL